MRNYILYVWMCVNQSLKRVRRDREMLRFYSRFIHKGDLCFDVGAHMGNRTEIFLKLGANVIAVEPQEDCINQLREKIGIMFGNPETTTGGNALKFYSSIRVDIRKIGQIKDNEAITGVKARVKIVKNKLAPPFKKAEFDIIYGEGISKIGEIVDLGVENNIVKKSGSWFSYGETKLGQGRESVKLLLKDNPELADELENKIIEAISKL